MGAAVNRRIGAAVAGTEYQPGSAPTVPLQSFAPDLPVTTPGILTDMDGAVPIEKGFRARPSPQPYAPHPLPQLPAGAFIANYSDGTQSLIAGTASGLYRLAAEGWVAIGGPYQITGHWRFSQFNDDVIAVAAGVAPQVANGGSGLFTALAGSPPDGATAIVLNFGQLFMFQGPNWYSGAVGADNDWTPNLETLAGTGPLPEIPGDITGAVSFFGSVIAFKAAGIWAGLPVGPPDIMDWQLISQYTGVRNQSAIVSLSDRFAFLGTDDFYVCQGYYPQPIPNHLKEWFFETADPRYLGQVMGWYDPDFATVYWHFVSIYAPQPGVADMYVAWNTRRNRWAKGTLGVAGVPSSAQPQVNRFVNSKSLYFDSNYVLQQLSGEGGPMRLRSWYIGMEGQITRLLRARATYNLYPAAQSLSDYSSYVLGQDETQTLATLGLDDWHNLRTSNRYHRLELTTSGDCEVMAFAAEGHLAGIR